MRYLIPVKVGTVPRELAIVPRHMARFLFDVGVAHQTPPPTGFPGKNTGVGCHFLLQVTKRHRKSEPIDKEQTNNKKRI